MGHRILKDAQITLPTLSEQHPIAEQLEKTDRLRRVRRYILELSGTFLPAAFLKLFGDWQPATTKYPVKRLEEVVQPERGVTYGIVQAGSHIPNGGPYNRTATSLVVSFGQRNCFE